MPAQTKLTAAELAAALSPSLLRLPRRVPNQRVDTSVSLAQLSAIGTLLKRGAMSAGELAACEQVQPPSMTKIIAGLVDKGMVTREAHPSDKRQAIVVLTQAGSDLLESERRQRTAWLTQRIAKLTADERRAIRDVIPVLDKLAEL